MTGLLLVMQARPKVSEEEEVWILWVFLFGRHYYEDYQSYK